MKAAVVTGQGNIAGTSVSELFGTGMDEDSGQRQPSNTGAQIDDDVIKSRKEEMAIN